MPRFVLSLASLSLFAALANAGSSNSLLDVHPDGSRLLAVNADNGSVTVVDLKTRKPLHEVYLGDKPEGATWVGQSSLALVTVYRDDVVCFIDTKDGKVVHRLKVEDEPYGVVALKDGSKAYVTLEYPGKVVEIDNRFPPGHPRAARRRHGARHRPVAGREAHLRDRVPHRRPRGSRPRVGQGRRSLAGAHDRQPGPQRDPPPGPAEGVRLAHPLEGPRQPRQRLDLPAGVDLRPRPRRQEGIPPGLRRHGHLQRRLRRDQPVGVGVVAGRQEAVHGLRRHQRHERQQRHRRRLPRDGGVGPAAADRPEPARGPHVRRTARRSTSSTRWTSPSPSTTRTSGRRSPPSRCATRRSRRSGCAARCCSARRSSR